MLRGCVALEFQLIQYMKTYMESFTDSETMRRKQPLASLHVNVSKIRSCQFDSYFDSTIETGCYLRRAKKALSEN